MTRRAPAHRRKRPPRSAAVRRLGRAAWPVVGTVVVLAVLVLGVFPTRTFLAQRSTTARTEKQLAVLRGANEDLARRVEALGTDAEVERLAREQYNLVRPGERAFGVLPAPRPKLDLPATWPFDRGPGAAPEEGDDR